MMATIALTAVCAVFLVGEHPFLAAHSQRRSDPENRLGGALLQSRF